MTTNQTRSLYTFVHMHSSVITPKPVAREVEFGPYATHDEAREAFQRRYGYWPAPAVIVRDWAELQDAAAAIWDTPMGRSMAQNND